ncbi:MAG: GMC family oxidoreductase [Bacteroidetes bacterium]|nr:GMC family oxidoreductase [Bacteroidota bacterium]MBS1539529.1 GMC family oxidoreductase [Bacteroidota bacterium]
MAYDSLNLNLKSKPQHTFDAIIVGSGISGGWAAKELCEKGLKVLLLERGEDVRHPLYPTATKDPWQFEHRLNLTEEDKRTHPIQSRHWSFVEDNKHYYIQDLENPYEEEKRFDWIRGDIVGGRSLLWSRACYRWSDLDFDANKKEGIAVDWPIRYKDIAPWYDYVESYVGVSGHRDGIPHLPDGNFLPPFEMNCVEELFKEKIEKQFSDKRVIMGRYANLTRAIGNRGPCQARNLCHRGCPYGAYFSSNSATLPAAFATGNLTLRPHSIVNKVIYDEQTQRATGVEVIDTLTNEVSEFYARLIFLNASTVATAYILLHSVSSRFPNGLGNDSDQVGRNLMDHHKGLSATADVEGFEDSYYSGRRPASIYVPRFRNLQGKDKDADFLRGYYFGGGAYRKRNNTDQIGAAIKEAVAKPGSWQMSLHAFGECLPYADNRITLNQTKKDKWGRPLLSVNCDFRQNEKSMNKDISAKAEELLHTAGFSNIRVRNVMSFPGNSNHEMGTVRMGRDPKTSVLNAFNQMHAVKNVFVTDGSCMTSSSCVNPSLTYMALTARACDYAVKQINKREI